MTTNEKITITVDKKLFGALEDAVLRRRAALRPYLDGEREPDGADLYDYDKLRSEHEENIAEAALAMMDDGWRKHALVLESTNDEGVTLYELRDGDRPLIGLVVAGDSLEVLTWEPDGEAVTLLDTSLSAPNAEAV